MSSTFKVRVGLGNGTTEQTVQVTTNNAKDAMRAAECQTGGRAKGQWQVPTTTPKK